MRVHRLGLIRRDDDTNKVRSDAAQSKVYHTWSSSARPTWQRLQKTTIPAPGSQPTGGQHRRCPALARHRTPLTTRTRPWSTIRQNDNVHYMTNADNGPLLHEPGAHARLRAAVECRRPKRSIANQSSSHDSRITSIAVGSLLLWVEESSYCSLLSRRLYDHLRGFP